MYGLPGVLPATGMGALTIMFGFAGFILVLLGALVLRVNMMRSTRPEVRHAGKHAEQGEGTEQSGAGRR
jgi:LPXTG-motif cell wall-anchored protein